MKYLTEELLSQLNYSSIIEGYSAKEIIDAENQYGYKFPTAYEEFLNIMGRRISFLRGLDYSMFDLNSFRGGAECYLYANFGEKGLEFLNKNDIVFLSSQGCSHYYMSINEGENPKVHLISEVMRKLEPIQSFKSFTEFIKNIGGEYRK